MLAEVRPDGFTMLDTYRLAFADGLFAVRDGAEIRVAHGDGIGAQLLRAQLGDDGALRLVAYNHRAAPADQRRALLAALAAAFSDSACHAAIRLDPAAWPAVALDALRASGVLADGGRCLRDGWAQQADLWRVGLHLPCATLPTITDGRRHPRRPPAPRGEVYARDLPEGGRARAARRGVRLRPRAADAGRRVALARPAPRGRLAAVRRALPVSRRPAYRSGRLCRAGRPHAGCRPSRAAWLRAAAPSRAGRRAAAVDAHAARDVLLRPSRLTGRIHRQGS